MIEANNAGQDARAREENICLFLEYDTISTNSGGPVSPFRFLLQLNHQQGVMSLIAVPSSPAKGNKWALRIAAPVVGITLLVVAFWFWGGFSSSSPVSLGQFYSVAP